MFLQFTPAYGFAFLQSGILPRAVFHKPPERKNRCGKRTQTAVFHTVFIPTEPSQSPAATIGSRLRGLDAKISPLGQTKCLRGLYKTIFYALAAAHTKVCSGAGVSFSLPLSGDTPQRRSCHPYTGDNIILIDPVQLLFINKVSRSVLRQIFQSQLNCLNGTFARNIQCYRV